MSQQTMVPAEGKANIGTQTSSLNGSAPNGSVLKNGSKSESADVKSNGSAVNGSTKKRSRSKSPNTARKSRSKSRSRSRSSDRSRRKKERRKSKKQKRSRSRSKDGSPASSASDSDDSSDSDDESRERRKQKKKDKKAAKKAKKAEKKRRKAEKRLQKSASSASKSDSKSSSGEDESSPDDRSSAAGEGVARQFNDKPQSIRLLAKNSVGMVEKQCIAAPPPGIPASRPVKGSMVTVHFTGYLMPGLKQFYTTRQTETNKYANLFKFEMGVRKKMIEGWDIAIASMMLGEKARFTISGNYGYGVEGCAAYGIAPYSTLVYDIEIMKIE